MQRQPIGIRLDENMRGLYVYDRGNEVALSPENLDAFCAWAKAGIRKAIGERTLIFCWGSVASRAPLGKLGESVVIRGLPSNFADSVQLVDEAVAFCAVARIHEDNVPSTGIQVAFRAGDAERAIALNFGVFAWAKAENPSLLRSSRSQDETRA